MFLKLLAVVAYFGGKYEMKLHYVFNVNKWQLTENIFCIKIMTKLWFNVPTKSLMSAIFTPTFEMSWKISPLIAESMIK